MTSTSQSRKEKQKVLTPKKRSTVKKHFKNFLSHYKFPTTLYNFHVQKINKYAHNAITGARKHLKLAETNAVDDVFEENDIEMIEL